jgi:sugar/nucleoside kinase (ribokinase family)
MVRKLPDQPSPLCVAISERGKKSFVACSTLLEYSQDCLRLPDEEVDLMYFGGYLLYPELWDGSLADFFERARGQALIVVDTQMLPIPTQIYKEKALSVDNLEHVGCLLTAWKEAEALTGCTHPLEAAKVLIELGPRIVIIKLGKDGSLTHTSEASFVSKSFNVQARDLIGAGDFYGAAFSYSLIQDWDLQPASDFANAFAALCVRRTSTQGIPDRTEVLAFMEIEGRAVPGSWR